ncbi:hypothetical protein AAIR98_000969 [Elusimicrobium simillimum]|uniref:LytR C-terminal domain-containing protein n=1 Tax=Elusimicrobium simillimum TaxID=3143438 RepID=UPI003C6F2522
MEPTGRKIINYLIIFLFLLIMLGSYALQERSFVAKLYTGKAQDSFTLAILTEPAVLITHNPADKATNVVNATLPKPKKSKTPPPELSYKEKTDKLLETKKINSKHVRFYVPQNADSNVMWDDFKNTLNSWRFIPVLCVKYIYSYTKALAQKRTNIMPHEFILLSLGAINMDSTDFTVFIEAQQKGRTPAKAKTAEPAGGNSPLTAEDRPLIVEIYNASGKKGAALELTQYLRGLNEKGFIKIDVLQYDNHSSTQEATQIVDHSGRVKELKQLSLALGLRDTAFYTDHNPAAFCDAKIIIGTNFKMPK